MPNRRLVYPVSKSGPRHVRIPPTRIGRAGAVRRQAAMFLYSIVSTKLFWLLCTGAHKAAFRNIKTIAECLAEELINVAQGT